MKMAVFLKGKTGKTYTFLTCGQLNITPKKQLCKPHTGNATCQNIHITARLCKIYMFLFCAHLHITAKNSTPPVPLNFEEYPV
jgi:hypothetical protein